MNSIRIMIVDDHQIIIDGLKAMLDHEKGISVVATALNGREAIEILKVLTIDIILMDLDMPVMDGLTATKTIKENKAAPGIIILSMHLQKGMVEELIKIGVDGYVLKNTNRNELINAIIQVSSGKKYFGPNVTLSLLNNEKTKMESNSGQTIDLTHREIEILKLITEGYTNKEIGEKLFISHRTVDTHRTNMMKKLDVNNVAGLIKKAIKEGIVY